MAISWDQVRRQPGEHYQAVQFQSGAYHSISSTNLYDIDAVTDLEVSDQSHCPV